MEISSTDLNRNPASYVTRAEGGESFDVTRNGVVVAHLGPPAAKPFTLPPATWQRHPSAGTAGSPVAADGRRHIRDFPCPGGLRYRLSDDRRMWLQDYPPINLKVADRILNAAFPKRR